MVTCDAIGHVTRHSSARFPLLLADGMSALKWRLLGLVFVSEKNITVLACVCVCVCVRACVYVYLCGRIVCILVYIGVEDQRVCVSECVRRCL